MAGPQGPAYMRKDGYFMKAMKRRLLSLFMAMVMVCSLVPVALATGEGDNSPENPPTEPAEVTITEVKVTGTNTVAVGGQVPLSATVVGSDNKILGNEKVTWASGNASVATVDSDGRVTGVAAGKATITATSTKDTTKKGELEVTVSNVEATSISLSNSTLTLTEGATKKLKVTFDPTNTTNKNITWTSDATSIATVDNDGTVHAVAEGSAKITATTSNSKTAECIVTVQKGVTISLDKTTLSLKYDSPDQTLTATVDPQSTELEWSVSPATGVVSLSGTGNSRTVTVTGYGDATITVKDKNSDKKATCAVTVDNPLTISSSSNSNKLTSMNSSITLTPYFDGKDIASGDTFKWTTSSTSYFDFEDLSNNRLYVTPKSSSKDSRSCTITAKVTHADITYEKSVTVSLQFSTEIELAATVSSDYYLSDVSDKGKWSVEDQLLDAVSDMGTGSSRRYLDAIEFSKVTSDYGDLDVSRDREIDAEDIGDILFTPKKNGTVVFDFTAYTRASSGSSSSRTSHTGTLTITVTDTTSSSGDVTFYGEVGEDVSFDSASFEDFWDDKFPGGDLDYVTFSPSGGTLYDGDGKKVTSSKECYVNPRKSNIGLDELYFEPSSTNSKKATTITFSFTAYGENKSGADKEASGRVSIVYMSDSPKDISYTVGSNGTVSLKASDFTAAYKEVISGSVPSNLTIVFQGVPKSGTLTYNDSSKKNAKDVTLTNSNIKKYSFTTKSSGSNQLNDITYSGTSGTDTIEYTAYSGSTPKFKGKVVFNGKAAVPTDVVVYFASAAGQPARFSQNDFVTANSALSKAVKYRFTAPANGTLYLNGATSAAGVDIASALLYSVTYQPKAGYNGSDKSVFMAYDSSNALVASGTVNFTIAGNPSTTTPTNPGNSGGVTDVSQFTDVSSTAWYRDNLATLVKKGVISGRGGGKFDPKGTVTYGEALKMVLEACGYTAVAGTGSQWAINYKNLAVSHGWISSDIDLTAAISRNATAELAARVLGVERATSGSPFADEANAYAVALYYTTPQIFVGTTNPNGGKPLFENNKPLLREQVCAVICRVSDYHTQHTTNAMPDGT